MDVLVHQEYLPLHNSTHLLFIKKLVSSELMKKTFQAAQLTHESFLTIDHSSKLFFWYLPNWTSTYLWCLYVTYSTTYQRAVEVQFGRYQKNILQEWSVIKNLSCVSCAAWNVFPINSLLSVWKALFASLSPSGIFFFFLKFQSCAYFSGALKY